MSKKDKFHGAKRMQQLNEGTLPDEEKSLTQRGVSFQNEATKSKLRVSDIEVSKDDVIEEFANRYLRLTSIEDNYGLSPKRKARILEKILCGPALPDKMIELKKDNQAEAAYYLAARDVQDVVIVLTEMLFNELNEKNGNNTSTESTDTSNS